jgi:hypothetical protein
MQKIIQIIFGIALAAIIVAIFVPVSWFALDPTVEVSLARLVSQRFAGQVSGDPDSVEFRVDVNVTPYGGDVCIDRAPSQSLEGGGFVWSLSPGSSADAIRIDDAAVTSLGPVLPQDVPGADGRFWIPDGVTRTFSLKVRATTLAKSASVGVRLDQIRWRSWPGSPARVLALSPDTFATDLVTGLSVR